MKKFLLFSVLPILMLAIPFVASGESPRIIFVENKTQWPSQVMFKADIKGGVIFLEKNTFTYSFMENGVLDDETKTSADIAKMKFHAFKVRFVNSNPNVQVSGNNLVPGILNFYKGNDAKKWATDCKQYTQVHYQGLYPSVDMNVYNVEENLKYDLLVHPGGRVENIRLDYTGPDGMYLDNGHLYIKTSVGLIIEQKPFAYQLVNGLKMPVPCSYILKNNTLSFAVGSYDPSLQLVIDPTLIGSTYTGSTSDNRGYTATYDNAGNMYTGGKVWAQGYPVTAGAWDGTANAAAGWDIVLTEFNTNASNIIWSTYYGGTSDQQIHSIIVNGNNELYCAGRTNSTDFPVMGAYQSSLSGGFSFDVIVGKFNTVGYLLASTYIGGGADDGVNVSIGVGYSDIKTSWGDDGRSEIIIDAGSNVYVASNTKSVNFPTTAGAYDNSLSGVQDGVVFKMNSTLSTLMFSTYLGGSSYDACYGLKQDNSGKIYVTGGTESPDFPIPVGGVLHPTFGGTADGFIAVFDPSLAGGAQLLRSTYLGTASYDQSYLIEIDASGDLYVYGQTAGAYGVFPVGVYSYPNANPSSGMFVHKLKGNLTTTVFSTEIGTAGGGVPLSPTAFLVDSCQTIYIAGWGRCLATGGQWAVPYQSSTIGLPTSPTALQPTTDGCDFYFLVLEPDAKKLSYATFFGGNTTNPEHVDGGTSRFDKRGVIYESVCAGCLGTSAFPTTPTAWSTTNKSLDNAQCNNAIVKMDVAPKPLAVASLNGPANGCAPFTVSFNNTGSSATDFIWDFGDGGVAFIPSPSHIYTTPGTYTITLYAIDSIGICGFIDTALVAINVGANPVISAAGTNIACSPAGVGSATVTVTPTGALPPLTYLWSPTGGNAAIANGLTAQCYSITVSDALGCSSTKTVCITQPPPLTLSTSTNAAICGFANGSATVTPTGGTPNYSYSWLPGGNINPVANGLSAGTYTITVTDSKGCTSQLPVTIPVAGGPTVTVVQTTPISCNGGNNGAASATVTGGTPPYTYLWAPTGGNGSTANGFSAGTYQVSVIDSNGCAAQALINITQPTAVTGTVTSVPAKCFGSSTGSASVTGGGGTPGYTYTWGTIPVQTGANANGLAAGAYSVVITDSKGCTSVQYANITQPPGTLSVNTSTSGSACGPSANGGACATVTNGTAPYTYLWMPGGQTSPCITNIAAGSYSVAITDANGCTTNGIATIVASIKPTATFTFVPVLTCDGLSMQFVSTSQNALTLNWDFGPGLGSSTAANPTFVFPYNGSYSVTLTATNPPCTDVITLAVPVSGITGYVNFSEANVFTPNGDGKNDCFHPTLLNPVTGLPDETLLPCLTLEVFDRWGIKMYETLGPNGANCWDGNTRNDSKPAKDGTYYYIAKLGETTIKGFVTLARHK